MEVFYLDENNSLKTFTFEVLKHTTSFIPKTSEIVLIVVEVRHWVRKPLYLRGGGHFSGNWWGNKTQEKANIG
jgi:hypothetical protein